MLESRWKIMLTFGTDGIRGNADQFPFADDSLQVLGRAIAQWACEKYGLDKPKLLIAMDTRISGPRIKNSLCAGLLAGGVDVVDAGVLSTPALCKLITQSDLEFNAGIVISASHNPYHDNGIKLFDAQRCKLSAQDEQRITELFLQEESRDQDQQEFSGDLVDHGVLTLWPEASESYQALVLSQFPAGFLKNVHVVLDCANGATYQVAPKIFQDLGARVTTIAVEPSGTNINDECGATHPEVLRAAVLKFGADCGFAFDGDGDRIVAVNSKGEIKDGDDIVAFLLNHARYQQSIAVVGTIMSNQGFAQYLEDLGKVFYRTKVGDKHVVAKLEEEKLLLGGEPSGHIVLRDYMATGDGVFVALMLLETAIQNNTWSFDSFVKYPQVTVNIRVDKKNDLAQHPFATIIADHETMLEKGRLVVRYSGTEPLLRVMVEASHHDHAHAVATSLVQQLSEKFLNS